MKIFESQQFVLSQNCTTSKKCGLRIEFLTCGYCMFFPASLHFSGHIFSISSCLSFVPSFDRKMRQYKDYSVSH